jgi:hypothetical protein
VTFQGSFSPSDDALQVRADFGNLSVSFDSIFNRGWSFLGRLETHLGRLHAHEKPSRPYSERFDLGDPVDIVTDLQALFVDGRGWSLVSALGGGFLGEKGGHREDCVV